MIFLQLLVSWLPKAALASFRDSPVYFAHEIRGVGLSTVAMPFPTRVIVIFRELAVPATSNYIAGDIRPDKTTPYFRDGDGKRDPLAGFCPS